MDKNERDELYRRGAIASLARDIFVARVANLDWLETTKENQVDATHVAYRTLARKALSAAEVFITEEDSFVKQKPEPK